VIEKYIGKGEIDFILVNSAPIWPDLVKKYADEENKQPVHIKDILRFKNESYKIIQRDLVNENDYIRHDPIKLSRTIADFVEGWIK
jgi:hypothetical protein